MVSARRLRVHLESREEPALLVVDNAVDADALRRFLPVVGPTHVIITSTDHASFTQLGAPVEVSVFHRAQSLAYLRARTRREDEAGADRAAAFRSLSSCCCQLLFQFLPRSRTRRGWVRRWAAPLLR